MSFPLLSIAEKFCSSSDFIKTGNVGFGISIVEYTGSTTILPSLSITPYFPSCSSL